MKRMFCLFLCLCLLFSGCAGTKQTEEVTIFAAASLTEVLTRLAEVYKADHPEVKLVFNFDSSGTLQTQIEEGAVCDLFLPAGQKQMDALVEGGFVDASVDLLENKIVLAVPEGNPADLQNFDDLVSRLTNNQAFLAIGGADVPAGQYAWKIFAWYGLDEEAISGCLTLGSNVKEVVTQVAEAMVDGGIIYETDARAAGLTVVDMALPAQCGQVIYPAAVLADGPQKEAAAEFLAFLASDAACDAFVQAGFTPLN